MPLAKRNGAWMQTFTGRQFWPLDPRPSDIDIVDIAAALSKMCRFGGHCLRFYSVAEHSVLLARAAPREHRLWALLHDAAEAYVADVPRPLKRNLSGYTAIEEAVLRAIALRFTLPWPMPARVKQLDDAILHDEAAQNMAPPPSAWNLPGEPLGCALQFWDPPTAQQRFLFTFRKLSEGV